jgi:hypothetical protein
MTTKHGYVHSFFITSFRAETTTAEAGAEVLASTYNGMQADRDALGAGLPLTQ